MFKVMSGLVSELKPIAASSVELSRGFLLIFRLGNLLGKASGLLSDW